MFARGGAEGDGEVEARNEEMEMVHVWDFYTDGTSEEVEDRTKDSWKACMLASDTSKSVYPALISMHSHLFQVLFGGFQSTTKSIYSAF